MSSHWSDSIRQYVLELNTYTFAQAAVGFKCLLHYECGKTQVVQILQSKDTLLSQYEANASGSRAHTSKSCSSEFLEVNKALYDWFVLACSENILPTSPQLIEKAKQKWKRRYNVKYLSICGESGDVNGETVLSWKERLPEIIEVYSKDDIWNIGR